MPVDKALLLKGVAGVAALGGVVAGGFVFKDQISSALSSSSSKPAADSADEGEAGTGSDDAVITQTSITTTEDPQGIPNRCNSSSTCELTEEELKKIKFEVLGDDETTAVTVEGFPGEEAQKLTLTIDSTDTNKKKYIFSNGSSNPVKIKRGTDESKIVTLDNTKKTKFSLSGGKLKQFTLNDYGLPSDCETTCTLTSTDLEDIKFEGLGTEAGTVTVTPKQKVSLTIETTPKRYKFNNASGSAITIKKGSDDSAKTVTLNNGETEYKENNGVLRYLEPTDNYGVPTRCNTTSPCDLSEENLKNIKFETLEEAGVSGDVEVESYPSAADQKITLTIDATEANKKKYIFSNGSSNDVKIKRGDTKSVTLKGSGRTKFTLSSDKLKQFELNDYGIPKEGCDSSCSLTSTDLEDIKFDGLEGTLTVTPTTQKVSLSAESVDSEKRFTFSTSTSSITIKGSSDTPSVTLSSIKTRFKGTNDNKLKKIELDDKGIPSDCTETCKLTPEDLKLVKFPGFDTAEGTVTVNPTDQTITFTKDTAKKEYSFQNSTSNPITITKGSVSAKLTQEGPTVFYEEDGKLVKTTAIEKLNEMLKKAGFPVEENCVNNDCCKLKDGNTPINCSLTKNKFIKLKFNNLGEDGMNESQVTINDNSPLTVKIEKDGTGLKIIFSGINGSMSIDRKSGTSSTFYLSNNVEYTINSQNKIDKKNSSK